MKPGPKPRPVADRFWEKVEKTDSCWLWTAYIRPDGYGVFRVRSTEPMVGAHRVAYELEVGPVPVGFTLDHLCRVRHCVRPDHLEPVTHFENCSRGTAGDQHRAKTHCRNGHSYDDENTYVTPQGHRSCRTCNRAAVARYRRCQ